MSNLINKYVKPFLKAHAASFSGALALLLTDANGNFNNLSSLSANQWIGAAIAALGVGAFVAAVPNAPVSATAPVVPAEPQDVVGA